MPSQQFLSLLQQALKRKNNLLFTYERFLRTEQDPDMLKIVKNMLEKEQSHLEILTSINESVRNGVDIPSHIYSMSANAGNAGGDLKSSLNLLMQSKTSSSQCNRSHQNTRSVNVKNVTRTHIGRIT